MSLVIAIKDKDRIVLGADKQASAGGSKDHTNTKIWKVDELPGAIMGSVGSARASQIIQYSHIVDKNLIQKDLDTDYIICVLAPAIAATLKHNGIVIDPVVKEETCPMLPNAFIFAYKERAWMIWNDLSVSELEEYLAIGSGADVAKGALFATPEKNPFDRIVTSIDAAATTTLFVDDGIDLLVTENREEDVIDAARALGLELPKPKVAKKVSEKKESPKKTKKKSKAD
jgi:20S proteasome alpha/beta subunit